MMSNILLGIIIILVILEGIIMITQSIENIKKTKILEDMIDSKINTENKKK